MGTTSSNNIHRNDSNEFGHEYNSTGPWAAMPRNVQNAIRDMVVDNMGTSNFAQSLDKFAEQWLKFKADVEDEASNYGFVSCRTTADIKAERNRVAVLSLTMSGSFLLLGNGCLEAPGGSINYKKIPLRVNEKAKDKNFPSGTYCDNDPTVGKILVLKGKGAMNTSAIQLLFYTTEQISEDNARKLVESVSESIFSFNQTVSAADFGDTVVDPGRPRRYDYEDMPEVPEELPMGWN